MRPELTLDLSSVGIVGGGGGMRGCTQVGWCEDLIPALLKAGAPIRYLGGTSVGALNMSKLAEAQTDNELLSCLKELRAVWETIEKKGSDYIFPLSGLKIALASFRKNSLLDGKTLWRLLKDPAKDVGSLDTHRLLNSPRIFDVFVENETTGRQEIFSNKDERVRKNPEILIKALVASASVPPFFPPVLIEGNWYRDCGYITLSRAIAAGCSTIFVLLPYPEDGQENIPSDFISRNFPWVINTLAFQGAKVRELDRIEIVRAKRISDSLRAFHTLHQEIRSLFWRDRKRKVVDSLIDSKLDRLFQEAAFSFKNKRVITVVEIYAERLPSTLFIHTAARGDISRQINESREQMKRKRQEWGLAD